MPGTHKIHQRKTLLKGFFNIEEVAYSFQRDDSDERSPMLDRWLLDRGDSAAALLYHTEKKVYLLAEQFRIAAHQDGGFLLEIPAGRMEEGESARQCLGRELDEELGYHVPQLRMVPITVMYASPGTTSERMHLYYAEVGDADFTGKGGGLIEEGEDIRTVEMTEQELRDGLADGRIKDGKTVAAVLWLLAGKPAGPTPARP